MSSPVDAFIQGLKSSPRLPRHSLVYHGVMAEEQAAHADPQRSWPEEIQECLAATGITRLYAHQSQAMEGIR